MLALLCFWQHRSMRIAHLFIDSSCHAWVSIATTLFVASRIYTRQFCHEIIDRTDRMPTHSLCSQSLTPSSIERSMLLTLSHDTQGWRWSMIATTLKLVMQVPSSLWHHEHFDAFVDGPNNILLSFVLRCICILQYYYDAFHCHVVWTQPISMKYGLLLNLIDYA